jgi:hypothetical protein
VGDAGLTETSALLRYLAEGTNTIKRDVAEYDGFVNRSAARVKPVLPAGSEPAGGGRRGRGRGGRGGG